MLNDSFKSKYLKYKNKYFELKIKKFQLDKINNFAQRGGSRDFDALAEKCRNDITTNNILCPSCKFFHRNVMLANGQPDTTVNFTKRTCEEMNSSIAPYFFDSTTDDKTHADYEGFNLTNPSIFLNPNKYKNISSYKITNNILGQVNVTIQLYNETIDTFCAEGNIVWVNKDSKVGTSGITSCMFVCIILNDDSKLCIHHNWGDYDEYFPSGIDNQMNYTRSNFLPNILSHVNGKIKLITYIGSIYPSLKKIYDIYMSPSSSSVIKNKDGHYIIDSSNNINLLRGL